MSQNMEHADMPVEHEKEQKPDVMYLGSLSDFGLGNPSGIPSSLAEAAREEREAYGERLAESLDRVTDLAHYGCIDGRVCVANEDGSAPEIRRRQVGGTGLLIEVALNGEAPIMDTMESGVSLGGVIKEVESDYEAMTGVKPSAHRRICGGVNGAVQDNETIAVNDALPKVAEAIMAIPAVAAYSGLSYDATLGARVQTQAGKTATWLKESGWNGDEYVKGVAEAEPAGVEDLADADDEFHGHRENAVVFVLSTGEEKKSISEAKLAELELGDAFVVNLDASIDMAHAMAGQRGIEGATQAFIANLTKHGSVANRLAHVTTPVYFIAA